MPNIVSVGHMAVYDLRRMKKFSMHQKRSIRASWLASTSLAACDRLQCKGGFQTEKKEGAQREKDPNTSEGHFDANHIARPRRLDRLKPLKSSGPFSTHSRFVLDLFSMYDLKESSNCVLETPRVRSFESPIALFRFRSTSTLSRSYFCPRHRLSRLRQSNRHRPL
jgi:hypothetical protein